MNPKDASNDLKPKRKYISVLGIFEILILLLGMASRISSRIWRFLSFCFHNMDKTYFIPPYLMRKNRLFFS